VQRPARSLSTRHHLRPMWTSTKAALAPMADVCTGNETDDAINPQSTKRRNVKSASFFDEVDEIMKRDSPLQYQRFLESKAASESRRGMQRRNEQSRRRLERKREFGGGKKALTKPNILQDAPPIVAIDQPPAFANNYDQRDSANSTKEEIPWYKQMDDITLVDEPTSSASNYDQPDPTNSTKEEMPWYKQRDDMSEFASGGTEQNTGKTLPNKYQHFLKHTPVESPTANESNVGHASDKKSGIFSSISKATPDTASKSDDDYASDKKGGIFSSISKSALNMKDANGKTSTSIPLSELFPTLYSNDLRPKEAGQSCHDARS